MKKSSIVFSTILFGIASVALAQTQPAAKPPAAAPPIMPTKIGTVNMGQAIASTKEGQKASADMNNKYGPKKAEYDKRQAEIDGLQDQLNKGAATMADAAKVKLQTDIANKQKDLKRFGEDAQAEMENEDAKVGGELQNKMQGVLQTFAIQNGYAVILDYGNQQSPVMWKAATTDITEDLIKYYDQMHPATAPAAPATAPTPKK